MDRVINVKEKERVLLLGVFETEGAKGTDELLFDKSMEELDALVRACEMEPCGQNTQKLAGVNNAFYMGTGKLSEIKERIAALSATLVVVNDTLTPTQLRNLQKELSITVMDRTSLILEIFKKRARSREAKLQVELANLQYIKPRLIGMWETQNRQGGASGSLSSKGEGETQLELDRREIDHRIQELRRELKEVEKERETQRKKRQGSSLPLVSLIGYTNAGKSAIMNAMLKDAMPLNKRDVFEENMLFATLDTSVRRIEAGDNKDFMLSDTVGFVNKLPTALIEAFKSTLEEVKEADLLLHVIDYSDPGFKEQTEVTGKMIEELSCGHIPVIKVYNKADACFPAVKYPRRGAESEASKSIYMSAKDDASISLLKDMITESLFGSYLSKRFLIPYDKGQVLGVIMDRAIVEKTEYTENGTLISARADRALCEKYREFEYVPDC